MGCAGVCVCDGVSCTADDVDVDVDVDGVTLGVADCVTLADVFDSFDMMVWGGPLTWGACERMGEERARRETGRQQRWKMRLMAERQEGWMLRALASSSAPRTG